MKPSSSPAPLPNAAGKFCSTHPDRPAICGTPAFWFCAECWLEFIGSTATGRRGDLREVWIGK